MKLRDIPSWELILALDSTVQRFLRLVRVSVSSLNLTEIPRLQPYCANCYRSPFQLPSGSTLSSCGDCQLAHYCSSCPASHNKAHCASLQAISLAERFQIAHFKETKNEIVPRFLTESPKRDYFPLSKASSWYDYYTKVSGFTMVMGLLTSDLEPLKDNLAMASALRAATGELSSEL
jgi:splicing suppressor protein 51